MSVVGIIAEFNPFHSGHEFLLNQARLVAGNDSNCGAHVW